jgi:hypothetical protein
MILFNFLLLFGYLQMRYPVYSAHFSTINIAQEGLNFGSKGFYLHLVGFTFHQMLSSTKALLGGN